MLSVSSQRSRQFLVVLVPWHRVRDQGGTASDQELESAGALYKLAALLDTNRGTSELDTALHVSFLSSPIVAVKVVYTP